MAPFSYTIYYELLHLRRQRRLDLALRRERVVGGRRVRAFGERGRREEGARPADAAMALGAAALACRWRKRAWH